MLQVMKILLTFVGNKLRLLRRPKEGMVLWKIAPMCNMVKFKDGIFTPTASKRKF